MENESKYARWIKPRADFTRTRRNLPHVEVPGGYYFTDSNTKEISKSKDDVQRLILTPEERSIVFSAIRFHDGKKYDLEAAVVMPDHFHTILHPLEKYSGAFFSLHEIFHSIKSYSSHQIKKGVIFQDENYDHYIRNEKDYYEKLIYLLNNPVEAALVSSRGEYSWLYYKHNL